MYKNLMIKLAGVFGVIAMLFAANVAPAHAVDYMTPRECGTFDVNRHSSPIYLGDVTVCTTFGWNVPADGTGVKPMYAKIDITQGCDLFADTAWTNLIAKSWRANDTLLDSKSFGSRGLVNCSFSLNLEGLAAPDIGTAHITWYGTGKFLNYGLDEGYKSWCYIKPNDPDVCGHALT